MGSDRSQLELLFEQTHYLLNTRKIDAIVLRVQKLLGVEDFETSLDWVSQVDMKKVNFEYRGKDSSTDVLSFPQQTWQPALTTSQPYKTLPKDQNMPPKLLGDILISLSDARENAASIGQGLDRELAFLIVHGILHLCGHDHIEAEEEQIMLTEQRLIMEHLQGSNVTAMWDQIVRIK